PTCYTFTLSDSPYRCHDRSGNMPPSPLPFEQDIQQMEELLRRMEEGAGDGSNAEEIRRIRRELTNLIRKKYSELTPWETVLVSRHPSRPQTADYIDMMFDEFVELHGDRA